jgi:hypothetical protein
MLAKKQRSTKDILQIMKFPLLAILLVSCISLVSAPAEKHNIRRQMPEVLNSTSDDDVTLIDQDPHRIVGGDEVDPPFRYPLHNQEVVALRSLPPMFCLLLHIVWMDLPSAKESGSGSTTF